MRSDTTRPQLSITVLNYNYGRYLPRCLDSILRQEFTDFEIILINDKSTDDSIEIIQPYLADPRIRLVDHQENMGFVRSLIEGCELSRGAYITVISADDWVLDAGAFRKQVEILTSNPQTAFVYTAYAHYCDAEHRESVWRSATESFSRGGQEAFEKLVLSPFLLHSGTMIRKSTYVAVGGYDANLRYAVDIRLWLTLCRAGDVAYLNEVCYAYLRHGSNMSRSKEGLRATMGEILFAIDSSFAAKPGQRRSPLHRKARRRALLAFVLDDIFRNQYRSGWRHFSSVFSLHPVETVFQRQTAIAALRTILGQRGFALFARLFSRSERRATKKNTRPQIV